MPENPTTALIKTVQSPALARVSNQLALTDKLLLRPEEPFLIPYRVSKNGVHYDQWGYCDSNKKIHIGCNFFEARPFRQGRAWVRDTDGWNCIDRKGNYSFESTYASASDFSEGFAAVAIRTGTTDKKWGIIDSNGNQITELQYDEIGSYSNGLVKVKRGNKWGYLDKNGEIAIPVIFDEVDSFYEELAAVKLNGIYRFIDRYGETALPFSCSSATSFSESLAAVSSDGHKWGFINYNGEEVIDQTFSSAIRFSEGLAGIETNESWGYIDKVGKEVIACLDKSRSYIWRSNVTPFSNGKATVNYISTERYDYRSDSEIHYFTGIIDTQGLSLRNLDYNGIGSIIDGITWVEIWDGSWEDVSEVTAYIDTEGNEYWDRIV